MGAAFRELVKEPCGFFDKMACAAFGRLIVR